MNSQWKSSATTKCETLICSSKYLDGKKIILLINIWELPTKQILNFWSTVWYQNADGLGTSCGSYKREYLLKYLDCDVNGSDASAHIQGVAGSTFLSSLQRWWLLCASRYCLGPASTRQYSGSVYSRDAFFSPVYLKPVGQVEIRFFFPLQFALNFLPPGQMYFLPPTPLMLSSFFMPWNQLPCQQGKKEVKRIVPPAYSISCPLPRWHSQELLPCLTDARRANMGW